MMIESSSNILDLSISKFVRNVAIAELTCFPLVWLRSQDNSCSSSINSATTGFPSVTRPDFSKCAPGILKVFQLKICVIRHTLYIKMAPKFIMFKDNTTQFFAVFNHPQLDKIECAMARNICCQENASRPFSTTYVIEQIIALNISGFHQDLDQL